MTATAECVDAAAVAAAGGGEALMAVDILREGEECVTL
jgi:hypothetical protein